SGRREVARGGQPQRTVAGAERDDGLHRALAERTRADDGRAAMILQRTRDNLGRRGRTAVDQDDDRLVLGEVAGARIEPLGRFGLAGAGRAWLALLKDLVGQRDDVREQPAGIVAQVDDEALKLVTGLGGEISDGLLQAL